MTFSLPILKGVLKTTLILSAAIGGAIVLVIGIVAFLSFNLEETYNGRIFPHVLVQDVDVGGLTPSQAEQRLDDRLAKAYAEPLRFSMERNTIEIPLSASSSFLGFETPRLVEYAMQTGRSGHVVRDAVKQLELRFLKTHIPFFSAERFESDALKQAILERSASFLPPAQDATLELQTKDEQTTFSIKPEQAGKEVRFENLDALLHQQIAELSFGKSIPLPVGQVTPQWKATDLAPLQEQANSWLQHAPFDVTAEGKRWTVSKAMLGAWIAATSSDTGLNLDLVPSRIKEGLTPWVSFVVRPAKDGYLELENATSVKKFVAPEEGIGVDGEKMRATLLDTWTGNASGTTLEIPLKHEEPLIKGPDAENLGIQEVIGVGTSNFAGSPTNRRKNIARGAALIHGALIAPGEEFSTVARVGEIDGVHGWFPELVIKDNKTQKEFGGGLCQIGTTVFRSALASGLPITERRNHSYRVRYYEPAGTDATIYGPHPDLRFLNDTGHWILITSRLSGDYISFTFWGTKDGRTVVMTKPTVSHIVAPPPKKLIETTDLKPGVKSCSEQAHAGATARFDYLVTYPTNETKNVTFTSIYRPWGEVCMIGVAPGTPFTTSTVDETGPNNPN